MLSRKFLITISLLAISFLLFVPLITQAGLVPCGLSQDDPDQPGDQTVECTACHLFVLTNTIIKFIAVDITPILGAILLAAGGFMWMTAAGDEKRMGQGKKIFTGTIVGLVIVFASFMIVGLILQVLVGENAEKYFSWREGGFVIKCSTEPPPRDTGGTSGTTGGTTDGTTDSNFGTYTHEEAANVLAGNGIGISSSGNCSDRTNPSCTSLEGIKTSTLNEAVRFENECGCSVTVTGGTEAGHSSGTRSHGTGDKIDIIRTAETDRFIENNYRFSGARSDGAKLYTAPSGAIYARESDHWDILGI